MDEKMIFGGLIVAIVFSFAGYGMATGAYEDRIESHCNHYGKYVVREWTMTCTKNKGE